MCRTENENSRNNKKRKRTPPTRRESTDERQENELCPEKIVRGVGVEAVVTVDVQLSSTTAMDAFCRWATSDVEAVRGRRRSRPMKARLLLLSRCRLEEKGSANFGL